ncbi:MAG: protein phosphatase CheZ [Deltaproteobacteria bacterium]|nr:protein phosphatase CheZ [Deltaproteobacteria bacterium]
MEDEGIKETIEHAKAIADKNLDVEWGVDKIRDVLADIAAHIEKIRQGFLLIDPSIKDTSSKVPETTNQLLDIDKTISNAANQLMGLTENLMTNHEKVATLLNRLLQWGEGLNVLDADSVAKSTIDELMAINKNSREGLMEVFTNLSFQDLAGQKIKKMKGVIEGIEKRLLEVLIVFGHHEELDSAKKDRLLKGLKESGEVLKQGLVDDILKNSGF